MNSQDLNFVCGLLDKAAEKLKNKTITHEEYQQLHSYLLSLNRAIYSGYKG